MDLKKGGKKKQGHCYSKREEAAWPLLFLINTDPVFCTLLFLGPYFDLGFQTDPCFQNKNSGCRLTGRVALAIVLPLVYLLAMFIS